jgi:predicted nuclease of predicted toxin-antitoxin system
VPAVLSLTPESGMLRILFDQNAPRQIGTNLTEHDVKTALQMGWDAIANGELIDAAEKAGFDVIITADQNLRYQQKLTGRRLALIVLTTNHWDIIRPNVGKIIAAVEVIQPGDYVTIIFDRPALRRRLFNPLIEC